MNSSNSKLFRVSSWLAASIVSLSIGVSAYAASSINVQHASGNTKVSVEPKTVVVYDLATIDTLHALDDDIQGVPDTPWPEFLSQYKDVNRYKTIGTLFEPDYEAVNSMQPDLIIVAGRSAPKYRSLSRIAPTIDLTVDPANLLDSVRKNVQILGEIFNKSELAQKKMDEIDGYVASVNNFKSDGSGLIVLTTGGKMSAYGPGSRFGMVHDILGVEPVAKDLSTSNHGQAISFEFIFKNDPDWLFVIDRDAAIEMQGESAKRLLDNSLIHKTKAWNNNNIVYLNPSDWYLLGSAGLDSLQNSINEVANAIRQ